MKYMTETIFLSVGALLALLAAGMGQDAPFRAHMWIFNCPSN